MEAVVTQPPKCTESIWHSPRWRSGCGNAAKHDPNKNGVPTKCGIHSNAAKAKREAKYQAATQVRRVKWDQQRAQHDAMAKVIPALRQIAAGYNDPRGLAQEVIAALDAASGGKHDDDNI
jgi:hypothetical protein